MFTNVIVGVDGDDGGRDAIALARLLCAPNGELILAHVYHQAEPLLRGRFGAVEEAATIECARELLERERERAGVEAQLRRRGSHSVGRGLHELSEALGADLLVIGSSHRGLLGRVLVGDETRAAIDGAPCAVAIAPTGFSSRRVVMEEIGVGYNGSAEAKHALACARDLAREHHCRLSAFQAVSIPAQYLAAPVWSDPGVIDDMVEDAREQIDALDGVEPHAAYGLPAEELTVYSASLDLLVIGSRGYGPLGRLVHGSTAQRLARSARCPLLVLTRASRTAAAPAAAARASEIDTAEPTGRAVGVADHH